MPIYRSFLDAPFAPEQVALMDAVFEEVCLELGLARKDDAFRDIIAEAILACAHNGIRDPGEMRRCTHAILQAA